MAVRKRTWKTRTSDEVKSSWIVDYTDQHGKRHIQTFRLRKEADAYHDEVRNEVRRGIHIAPSDSLTVKQAAENWIKRAEADGLEPSTLQGYRQQVDLHIVPRIGTTKVAKLTHQSVERFRDDLLKDLSRPMARKVLTSFKIMLKQARFAHVAADVRIKTSRDENRGLEAGRDFPTTVEVRRLIAHATTPRQKALLLTVMLTGLRASELRGLRWDPDVDLTIGELRVQQRADRYRKIGVPKSAAGRRKIPLPPELIAALKEWQVNCPLNEAKVKELVFPSPKGKIDHNINLWRTLAPVMKAAGVVTRTVDETTGKITVEPKYGMHSFRHFFASWCINAKNRGGRELPPKEVQVLLGHSKIAMTLDVYGHLFPERSDRSELAEATRLLLS